MNSIERLRATYEFRPVDHLFRREFYIWDEALEKWQSEGMPVDANPGELFGFDEPAHVTVDMLGWCEPAFCPPLAEEVIEATSDYELIRDAAGRTLKVFKGRRHGFMPTYVAHPVSCEKDWRETVGPLLSLETPERWADFSPRVAELRAAAAEGMFIRQNVIGGYMYLRALVGPVDICYMLVDDPALVHAMMRRWLELADAVSVRLQEHLAFDELFLGEDICYKGGLLISPDMVREFIVPYYQQLIANIESRQRKHLFVHIDTDGRVEEVLDLYYREIGMRVMSPFEIAAGNDVTEIAKQYPDLVMSGGIDKRVLAEGAAAIDAYLERVIPFMVERGGYIPMCDHGVPDNVNYADYRHYRKRLMQLDH
ncbi:MAG: uroporphyrinogen decarboxylase family protein [Planctomycetota bacterium]|jgi:uroporphyrinogen decarboxylase